MTKRFGLHSNSRGADEIKGLPISIDLRNTKTRSCYSCLVLSLHVWTEYGDLRRKIPNSVQMQENTDQKKTPYLDTFHAVLESDGIDFCGKNRSFTLRQLLLLYGFNALCLRGCQKVFGSLEIIYIDLWNDIGKKSFDSVPLKQTIPQVKSIIAKRRHAIYLVLTKVRNEVKQPKTM